MSQQTHLFKRNSTYYFRAKVPIDLQRHLGKCEEKFSLKTKDRGEARRLARQVSADSDRHCRQPRDELQARQASKTTSRVVADDLIQEVCALWRHHALAGDEYGRQERWFSDELDKRAEERRATRELLRDTMLQVFMPHPRVQVANYFKFTDRSFMGWVDVHGQPKVPYWVFKLYARNTGDVRIKSSMTPPRTYSVPQLGIMEPESNVPELTQIVTRNSKTGRLYINLVNRSMKRQYTVNLQIKGCSPAAKGEVLEVTGKEPTANNGPDILPEWRQLWRAEYEPYTTARPHSIRIRSKAWKAGQPLLIPLFSVLTLVLDSAAEPRRRSRGALYRGAAHAPSGLAGRASWQGGSGGKLQ